MMLEGEVRECHTIVTVLFNVYKITGGIFSFKNRGYFDCASEYINFSCVYTVAVVSSSLIGSKLCSRIQSLL